MEERERFTIDEFKRRYGDREAYRGKSDEEIARAIRDKYYPNMRYSDFGALFGVPLEDKQDKTYSGSVRVPVWMPGSSNITEFDMKVPETAEAYLRGAEHARGKLKRGALSPPLQAVEATLPEEATWGQDAKAKLGEYEAQKFQEQSLGERISREHPVAYSVGKSVPQMIAGAGKGFFGPVARVASVGALGEGGPMERGMAAGRGALEAAAAAGIAEGGRRLITPVVQRLSPAQRAAQAAAEKQGYRFSVGQKTGSSTVHGIEDMLARNMGGKGQFDDLMRANQATTNRLAREAVGVTDDLSAEGFQKAQDAFKALYGQFDSSLTIPVGKPVIRAYNAARSAVGKGLKSSAGKANTVLDDVAQKLAQYQQTGLPGDVYQAIRSDLTEEAFRAGKGSSRHALRLMRDALDDAARAAGGPERALLDKQYVAYKTLLTTKGAVNEVTGDVNAAVISNKLGEKALAGQRVAGTHPLQPIRDFYKSAEPFKAGSPTAERAVAQILTNPQSAMIGAPIAASNAALARLLTNPTMERYLVPGAGRQAVADSTRAILMAAGLGGGISAGAPGLLGFMARKPEEDR